MKVTTILIHRLRRRGCRQSTRPSALKRAHLAKKKRMRLGRLTEKLMTRQIARSTARWGRRARLRRRV